MIPAENKLSKVFGVSEEAAAALVAAGYKTPRRILNAKDSDLMKVVKPDDVEKLRARWKAKE